MSIQSQTPQCEPTEVLVAMERVNAAIASADSHSSMLSNVLEEMLDIFHCDRAWLLYPCDFEVDSFRIPMERTRPEWPGAADRNLQIPADDFSRQVFRLCMERGKPVAFFPGHIPVDAGRGMMDRFHIRSQLLTSIHPPGDSAWLLGIHHCEEAWQYDQATELFRAIGSRVADGLMTFLATRELRRSEEWFRTLVEHAPDAILIFDCDDEACVEANRNASRFFGVSREQILGSRGTADFSPELQPCGGRSADLAKGYRASALDGGSPAFEWVHQNADGHTFPCDVRLVRLPHPTRRLIRASVLDVTERKRSEEERRVLEGRLTQAQELEVSVKMETARALVDLRRRIARAEETERSRIARELHDDLSQRLAALALEAQVAQKIAPSGASNATMPAIVVAMGALQEGIQEVARDVHALSRQLHPTILDDLGLLRALRSECAFRMRAFDGELRFESELTQDDLHLNQDAELALFRIAQESIHNAIKHAVADSIHVRLFDRDGCLILETIDDGRGIDEPLDPNAHGLGLASMGERALLIGAELEIHSALGAGTTVRVSYSADCPSEQPAVSG